MSMKQDLRWSVGIRPKKVLKEGMIDTSKKTLNIKNILRNKMIEEADAINSYTDFLNFLGKNEEQNKEIIEAIKEIRTDEQSHFAILQKLLIKLDPDMKKGMEKGMKELEGEDE